MEAGYVTTFEKNVEPSSQVQPLLNIKGEEPQVLKLSGKSTQVHLYIVFIDVLRVSFPVSIYTYQLFVFMRIQRVVLIAWGGGDLIIANWILKLALVSESIEHQQASIFPVHR